MTSRTLTATATDQTPPTTTGSARVVAHPSQRRISKKRLIKETGTDKLSTLDEMIALMTWPGLYGLSTAADEALAERRAREAAEQAGDTPDTGTSRNGGRRQHFPTGILLYVIFAARITGSLASALTELRTPGIWRALEESWQTRPENAGVPFPVSPPNRDQVMHLKASLEDAAVLEALQDMFQRIGAAQTRRLGNGNPGTAINWAEPDLRHSIVGDGMVLKQLSDVKLVYDPTTGGTRALGSRALKTPRIGQSSDLREDDKTHLRGINHVVLHTPTVYGPVVLATGFAQRAEVYAALDLLDQVLPRFEGAIHNLLWDRIFTGRILDYMMGRHRVRVFNKAVAETAPKSAATETSSDFRVQRSGADEHLHRLLDTDRHDVKIANLDDEERKRAELERASLVTAWSNEDFYRIHYSKAPAPLGMSLYRGTSAEGVHGPRSQQHRTSFELVRSKFRHLGVEAHPTERGVCEHDLYVDDDALHSVEFDSDQGCLVKVATANCLRSVPRARGGNRWGSTDTWLMPCPHGDFEVTTKWDPTWTRPEPGDDKSGRSANAALSALRPISRSQAQEFANIANHRNGAESWNNWYQRRLPNYGRAASLSIEGQMLDLLGGGCVRNALTWAEWLLND